MNIRDIDGEPHEVAFVAGSQVEKHLQAAIAALPDFAWAARGAWMTSEDHRTGEMPQGEAFEATSLGRRHQRLADSLAAALAEAGVLVRTSSWNPRST